MQEECCGLCQALRWRWRDHGWHQREQHRHRLARLAQHPHAWVLPLDHQGRVDSHDLVLELEWDKDARQSQPHHRILEEHTQIQGKIEPPINFHQDSNEKKRNSFELICIFSMELQGFVISDWQGIDRITTPPHANYSYSIQAGVSAGIDMVS